MATDSLLANGFALETRIANGMLHTGTQSTLSTSIRSFSSQKSKTISAIPSSIIAIDVLWWLALSSKKFAPYVGDIVPMSLAIASVAASSLTTPPTDRRRRGLARNSFARASNACCFSIKSYANGSRSIPARVSFSPVGDLSNSWNRSVFSNAVICFERVGWDILR